MNYLKDRSSYIIVLLGFFSVIFFALSLFFSTLQKMNDSGEISKQAAATVVSQESSTGTEDDSYSDASFGLSKDLVIYQVEKNDSTWKIAEELLGDGYRYVEIEVANGLIHNEQLKIGQMLFISQSKSISFTSIDFLDEPVREISENREIDLQDRVYTAYHTVEIGDSLWEIADMQYGDPEMWQQMYMKNYDLIGENPSLIQPGMELEI